MNSLELFNRIYTNEMERTYSISLLDFFKVEIQKRLPGECHILDIGSGSKSFFEEDLGLNAKKITAVDFSPVAIAKAQGKSAIDYVELDVTNPGSLGSEAYDLIFDSHCIHCIIEKKKRQNAFENIFNALKPSGIAALEMMVFPAGKTVTLPGKYVVDARNLEEELLSYKFKIKYFMIVRDLVFEDQNSSCDVMRVIIGK